MTIPAVDAAVNPVPADAATPGADVSAPDPIPLDGGSGPDVAPATPGTPPPLGMRANLEDTVTTRWVGTRARGLYSRRDLGPAAMEQRA
jgi:hypothetical protein